MDEKYLEMLYNSAGGNTKLGSFVDFKEVMGSDDQYRRTFYNSMGKDQLGDYYDFESLVKKKDGGTTSSDGQIASSAPQPAGVSTADTPRKITSMWEYDELGRPTYIADQVSPVNFLNRRERAEFARQNGFVMSTEKQTELAKSIRQRPVTSVQSQKDQLIEVVGADFDELLRARTSQNRNELLKQGYDPYFVEGEADRRARDQMNAEGLGDAITYVDKALENKDYKSIRDKVNNFYGRKEAVAIDKYTADPTGANWVLQGVQAVGWDGVYDEVDKELGPLKRDKARANLSIDQLASKDYSFTNPIVKQGYDAELDGAGKPINGSITPNQYTGLRYLKENNPEMYGNMLMEIGKANHPQTFGREVYDKGNRDYQYMMYQLDKKGIEINAMAINNESSELRQQKNDVDVSFRTRISNITTQINNTKDYDKQQELRQQLTALQEEYAMNPVIQRASAIVQDAQALNVDFANKYPDQVSRSRERMVKDILSDNLKGDNWFTKILETNYDKFSWLVGDVKDFVGNVTGISEYNLGASRNYFSDLRRAEEKEDQLYQPAGTSAVEAMYKLNFNSQDYATIKNIESSDLDTDEKAKAIGDYLEANQERIRYIENPNVGKRNWTFGAIGNQISDVGTQVLFQAALTELTAGFGRVAMGVRAEAAAIEAGAVASRAEAASLTGLDAAGASIAGDIIGGVNQAGLAFKTKFINLGSIVGSTYATAYQPAYVYGLQSGMNEEEAGKYAGEIAMVNALSETISPDIEIVKRAGRGVRGLATDISPEMLLNAKKFNRRAFAKGYMSNMVPETMEEIVAAYGEYGVDALNNMSIDEQNSLGDRIQNAAINTMIGMAPFGVAAGVSSYRANSPFQREAFYQAGLYPQQMTAEIKQLIDEGGLTQQEGNRRIQIVNTMENIIKQLPNMEDGTPMDGNEKQSYAYNAAQIAAYTDQLEGATDPNAQRQIERSIEALSKANQAILNGGMRNKVNPTEMQPDIPTDEVVAPTEGSATVEEQPSAAVEPAPKFVPGSTLQTADLGDLPVIAERNGLYTLQMPNGERDQFTAQEIEELIAPTGSTPFAYLNSPDFNVASEFESNPNELKKLNIKRGDDNIGQLDLKKDPDGKVRVRGVEINEGSRRQGIAEGIYKRLNQDLINSDLGPLHSDIAWKRNEQGEIPGRRLWEKLVNEGVAIKVDEFTYRFLKPGETAPARTESISERPTEETTETAAPAPTIGGAVAAGITQTPTEVNTNEGSNNSASNIPLDDVRAGRVEADGTNTLPGRSGVGMGRTGGVSESEVVSARDTSTGNVSNTGTAEEGAQAELSGGTTQEQVLPATSSPQEETTQLPAVEGEVATEASAPATPSISSPTAEIVEGAQATVPTVGPVVSTDPTEITDQQRAASEAQEEVVDESGGLSEQEQAVLPAMSLNDLYEGIIAADPNSEVRDNLSRYNRGELEIIYKAARASAADVAAQAQPGAAQQAESSAVSVAVNEINEAKKRVAKRKADMDAIKNKKSTDYQVKQKLYENAQASLRTAERNYTKALAAENTRLFRQKRGNLNTGLPFSREDAQIISNYVKMARVYISQGIRTLQEFASQLGEDINEHMRRAWQTATAEPAPVQEEGEPFKKYLSRLRAWEKKRVSEAQVAGAPEQDADARMQATQMRMGVRKLPEGVALFEENPAMGRDQFNQQLGLDENEYETYVASLKWVMANNRSKRSVAAKALNSLRNVNPKLITSTEMALLRNEMAAIERGSISGYEAASARMSEIHSEIQSILKNLYESKLLSSGNFDHRDLVKVGMMVNNARNEAGIQNLSDFFQELIDNSSAARTVEDIKSFQGRLTKLLKSKDTITANMIRKSKLNSKTIMQALKGVNPLEITEKLRFAGMLDNLVNSLEGKAVLETSNDDLLNFLDNQGQSQLIRRADQVKERYTKTIEIADENQSPYSVNEVLDQDEFDQMVDAIMVSRELSREGKMKELRALHNSILAFERQIDEGNRSFVSLPDIYDQIKEVNSKGNNPTIKNRLLPMINAGKDFLRIALEAPDFAATPTQKGWINSMINLDVSSMSNKELSLFKNTIDNIFVNNDFSGVEAYDALYKGQQRISTLLNWAQSKGVKAPTEAFTTVAGRVARALSSTDQIIQYVANGHNELAVKFMSATGLGDVKAQHAQAKQLLDNQIVKPLKQIYKKNNAQALRSPESNFKRSMYAYLSENNFGNTDDIQREFDRRKSLIQQDITVKKGADEQETREEAEVLEKVFNENFSNINSYNQLQQSSVLNTGEKQIYDLFRSFYDSHKEDFRGVTESLLNRPFNDVNNYVKDAYKVLKTNVTDVDFQNIGSSTFVTPGNPSIASDATLERNTFTNLENIPVTDNTGRTVGKRVINHDFDNVQINNSAGMLEDIYTLKTRMEAMEALEDPRLKQWLGPQNTAVLAENVTNQVLSQMKMRNKNVDGSFADEFAEGFANTVNSIGVRQVLYSASQLLKQPVDIITNTIVNLGSEAGYYFRAVADHPFFSKHKDGVDDLLSQAEISLRGKTFGGTNWASPQALTQIKNSLKQIGENADLKEADRLAWTIEAPDTWAARVAWLAYYAQSLKAQGLVSGYGDVDWRDQANNINREARDYAQLMTSSRLNVNSRESQSEFYAKAHGIGRLARVVALPLSSFTMNNNALLAKDLRALFTNDSKEVKLDAARSLVSRMVAEIAFQSARVGVSMFIKARGTDLLELFGIEPPPQKPTEFWKRVISESVLNMFFGLLGNISQDFFAKRINEVFGEDAIYHMKENPNYNGNSLGSLSMAFNPLADSFQYMKDIIGTKGKDGEEVATTPAEKAVLGLAVVSNLLAIPGWMEGDSKRVFNQAAQAIERDKAKERKDPYWRLMNDPAEKPKIKLNGKDVEFTEEQLEYYQKQRKYHLEQNKDREWTDEHKSRNATDRAKSDLQKEYRGRLKYKGEK